MQTRHVVPVEHAVLSLHSRPNSQLGAAQQGSKLACPHLPGLQDPQSGTRIGLQLRRLHTCLPGEAEHASMLLSDDAGVLTHASAAARGSIQKQFAMEGLALYWQPGTGGGSGSGSAGVQPEVGAGAAERAGAASDDEGRPSGSGSSAASDPLIEGRQPQAPPQLLPSQSPQGYVLHPTDCVVHATLQLWPPASGGNGSSGGMRAHVAAVVHRLQLSLDGRQAAAMLALGDRLAWCTAHNKYAAYCPAGWRRSGPRTVPWRWVRLHRGWHSWIQQAWHLCSPCSWCLCPSADCTPAAAL